MDKIEIADRLATVEEKLWGIWKDMEDSDKIKDKIFEVRYEIIKLILDLKGL